MIHLPAVRQLLSEYDAAYRGRNLGKGTGDSLPSKPKLVRAGAAVEGMNPDVRETLQGVLSVMLADIRNSAVEPSSSKEESGAQMMHVVADKLDPDPTRQAALKACVACRGQRVPREAR